MLLTTLKSFVYDKLVSFNNMSYTCVLNELPKDSYILDVGIGTGSALIKNRKIILDKQIRVLGIDINKSYLERAGNIVSKSQLANVISLQFADICAQSFDKKFDAVYFSDSFMLIPKEKKIDALKNAIASIKDSSSKIYFTQTHEKKRSVIIEFIKPRIKFFSSIDFGKVTYEQEFLQTLHEANLCVISKKIVWDMKRRSMVLITATPC